MIKTTGREFKRFYHDPDFWLPEGETWHDDTCIRVNGVALTDEDPGTVPDNCVIELESGWVYGVPPRLLSEVSHKAATASDMAMVDYFQLWLKRQTTVSLVVECERNQVDAVIAAVTAAGGKVLR